MANNSAANAQQVVVNISANTQGFTQAVQTAQQSLQGLQNTNVANNSVASLRQQLRDATNDVMNFQSGYTGFFTDTNLNVAHAVKVGCLVVNANSGLNLTCKVLVRTVSLEYYSE